MTLQGKDRWEYIKQQEAEGLTDKVIAWKLGLTYGSYRNWKYLNKKKFEPESVTKIVTKKVDVTLPEVVDSDDVDYEYYWSEEFKPTLIDTRSWTWDRWLKTFRDIIPFDHQIENFQLMERMPFLIINDPRRYGKTTICAENFILRKLCETVFMEEDFKIAYLSAVMANVEQISLDIAHELTFNVRILQNYGYLIQEKMQRGRRMQKNTMTEITLKTRKKSFGSSYVAMNVSARIRGAGWTYVIIDDPIDTAEEQASHYRLLTKKLIYNIQSRILPVVKDGKTIIIGTRYDLEDVYFQLESDPFWHMVRRKAVLEGNFIEGDGYTVPEKETTLRPSDIIIHHPEEWKLLAQGLWENLAKDRDASPIQNIVHMYLSQTDRVFSQEFQNEPKPLLSIINFEDFQVINELPTPASWDIGTKYSDYNLCIHYDDASGESVDADMRCLSLLANKGHHFYLLDLLFFKSIGTKKLDTIATFYKQALARYQQPIALMIEVVMNQREAFQRLRDEYGLPVQPLNPRGRGDKEFRINNNLVVYLEQGRVFRLADLRHASRLEIECHGYPSLHVDGLDSIDQAVFYLASNQPVTLPSARTV